MKFITTKDENGKEELFMFPRSVHHDCMMEMLALIKNETGHNWKCVFRTPVSAGFVDGTVCYGNSETLGLKARGKEDSELLEKQMQGG